MILHGNTQILRPRNRVYFLLKTLTNSVYISGRKWYCSYQEEGKQKTKGSDYHESDKKIYGRSRKQSQKRKSQKRSSKKIRTLR